jgi:predicted DNA-binding protein
MSSRKTVPMSLRLSPELSARLEDCAKRLRQKKHALAQEAIEAAVNAIEENDYRLVVPIEFSVARVPAPAAEDPASPNLSSSISTSPAGAGSVEPKQKKPKAA